MSTGVPKLSIGLAPGRHTVDLARLAVDLGCERVYLYDSAAVYEDVFIWLARLAELTDAPLGAAVLVPNLRHVMTTASAIATLEDLAPGRFVSSKSGYASRACAGPVMTQRSPDSLRHAPRRSASHEVTASLPPHAASRTSAARKARPGCAGPRSTAEGGAQSITCPPGP